ncbi:hypothetical protein CQ012_02395 [Arthrobacter sp. MYb214]|uniref:hypothetical protein n=1 Tax=Arthrobacter sp. MYb214 TaxID=1848596 RepID=UPI000CFB17C6|nr:hypothetical protein [Arthrobacter sp. MYb214]PRB78258.1 hypothetical protein CQ012_02395 [Arthrobacter sp. MYb214]
MTTTREARHLSGADLGKTIEFLGKEPGDGLTYRTKGTIVAIEHEDDCVSIDTGNGYRLIRAGEPVTITGTDTPPGLNLHRSVLDQDG